MRNLTHDQLVEKTARAQWKAISDDANGWDTLDQIEKFEQFARARAAIAAVREAIKDPTEAMMEKSGYRSMHAASPLYPEGV